MSGDQTPRGVIHDIGYRSYRGPRLGRGEIRRSLMWQGLGHAFGFGRSARSRIIPTVLVVIMLLPSFVVAAAVILSGDQLLIEPTRYAYTLQAVVTLFLAAQAPQLFSRDLRYRSIVHYLARPLTRLDYVVARLGALALALFAFTAAPILVITAGRLMAEGDVGDILTDLGKALVGCALLAILLAAIGGIIAAMTPRRGFAVAAIVAVILVAATVVTVIREVLSAEARESVTSDYVTLLSPFTLTEEVQALLVRTPEPLPTAATLTHAVTYAALVALCVWLLHRRYVAAGRS